MAESTRPAHRDALLRLAAIPRVPLIGGPTPVEEMSRLRAAIGGGARLLVKRDDAIPFGFGGNKTRKLEFVAADARAAGADTLVTLGGVQSNHARATAATAAKLGFRCLIIANGTKPEPPRANALLDELLGADIEYIPSRNERAAAMASALERLRGEGRKPYAVPLGASTPVGALGYVRAVGELLEQIDAPDVIVHASSSSGTQAGLVTGCILNGLATRVVGVSADDPSAAIAGNARSIIAGIAAVLSARTGRDSLSLNISLTDMLDGALSAAALTVDDTFVGDGYGIPSAASREAQKLAARTEAIFVDNTYTAKALAALIAYVRTGRFRDDETVLFWHTGGQVGIFA
jgi:1-aminocyclopropane-1-carboxylate deaminase/D-cysteine desulfhydrase-like pyridoxal-dependent ACC family enzyme